MLNATGAGDAFLAGLVYSYLNDYKVEDSAKFAMASAAIALSSKDTISNKMTVQNVNTKVKEMGLC